MTYKQTKIWMIIVFMCLSWCEGLFYTSRKQNDYPRIGKRPRYPNAIDKIGFSKVQSDIFTHKLGGREEFVHSLRESVIPADEDSTDLIDVLDELEDIKQERYLQTMRNYVQFLKDGEQFLRDDHFYSDVD